MAKSPPNPERVLNEWIERDLTELARAGKLPPAFGGPVRSPPGCDLHDLDDSLRSNRDSVAGHTRFRS